GTVRKRPEQAALYQRQHVRADEKALISGPSTRRGGGLGWKWSARCAQVANSRGLLEKGRQRKCVDHEFLQRPPPWRQVSSLPGAGAGTPMSPTLRRTLPNKRKHPRRMPNPRATPNLLPRSPRATKWRHQNPGRKPKAPTTAASSTSSTGRISMTRTTTSSSSIPANTRTSPTFPERIGTGPMRPTASASAPGRPRSEEHTSELQSRFDLVCRLLLEKKT